MNDPLSELFAVIVDRRENPQETSYTCKLFAGGDNKILKKEVVRLIQFNQEQSELNKQLVKGLSIALHHENSISIPYYGVVGQA